MFVFYKLIFVQALISFTNVQKKVIVQAVQELFDKITTEEWAEGEERLNRLIFIGKVLQCLKKYQRIVMLCVIL